MYWGDNNEFREHLSVSRSSDGTGTASGYKFDVMYAADVIYEEEQVVFKLFHQTLKNITNTS